MKPPSPTLGKSRRLRHQSIGPTCYKTVTGLATYRAKPQTTASEANAVADAVGTHTTPGLAADSQLNDFTPDEGDANVSGLPAIGAID